MGSSPGFWWCLVKAFGVTAFMHMCRSWFLQLKFWSRVAWYFTYVYFSLSTFFLSICYKCCLHPRSSLSYIRKQLSPVAAGDTSSPHKQGQVPFAYSSHLMILSCYMINQWTVALWTSGATNSSLWQPLHLCQWFRNTLLRIVFSCIHFLEEPPDGATSGLEPYQDLYDMSTRPIGEYHPL